MHQNNGQPSLDAHRPFKILVVVPFPMSEDNLALRRTQVESLRLGRSMVFDYRPVKAGPTNYASHHDFVLADLANFEAAARPSKRAMTRFASTP